MRYALAIPVLAFFAFAAPRPQNLELDQVEAEGAPDFYDVPDPDSAPVIIDAQPEDDVTATGIAAIQDDPLTIRDLNVWTAWKRGEGNCAKLPSGTYTGTSPAEDPVSFVAYGPFANASNSALAPYGYSTAFTNLTGSSQASSFAGVTSLSRYDPALCSSFCDSISGCVAFNIYFERDPSKDAGANCPNPASVINIQCTAWRVQLAAETATNVGQYRDQFHVVIAGSNGYNKWAPPSAQANYTGPVTLGGGINAPLDPITGQYTYMGAKYFKFDTTPGDSQMQAFNPAACTAACTAQTAYNAAYPPQSGNYSVCNQVVASVLSKDGMPLGMYCSMYTEVWSSHYAVNYGQYTSNGDYYSVSSSYYYTAATSGYPDGHLYTDAPICNGAGCHSGDYNGGNCGGWGAGTC